MCVTVYFLFQYITITIRDAAKVSKKINTTQDFTGNIQEKLKKNIRRRIC